jgi:hypothetical protein
MYAAAAVPFRASPVSQRAHVENHNQEDALRRAATRCSSAARGKRSRSGSRPSRFPSKTTKEQTVRRVMVGLKVRADQAATNEQVGGCDHPGTERNQR